MLPDARVRWLEGVDSDHVQMSCVFSGIATEQHVGQVLLDKADVDICGVRRFVHTAAFEIQPGARELLIATIDGPIFGDIAALLSPTMRKWASAPRRIVGEHKRNILEQRVALAPALHCHRSGAERRICLGDVSVAGIPCVDYFPMGLRREAKGPTDLLVLISIRSIQVHLPLFVIVEEVPQFEKHGLALLK